MKLSECKKCRLYKTRTQVVKGRGSKKAKVAFIGEAPGFWEDKKGVPFYKGARAGGELSKWIKILKLKRGKDTFILNVLCCRPPNNRSPKPDEIAACRPRLERTLKKLDCELIICLGAPAASALLGQTSVGAARGRLHTWNGKKVIATYHPAYILRNRSAMKIVADDLDYASFILHEIDWKP